MQPPPANLSCPQIVISKLQLTAKNATIMRSICNMNKARGEDGTKPALTSVKPSCSPVRQGSLPNPK